MQQQHGERGVGAEERPRHRSALPLGAVVEHGAGGDGIHFRVGEGVDHARDPPGGREAVGVQPQDEVTLRGVISGRGGGGDAALAAEHHTGTRRPRDGGTVVGGGVVDHDDLVGGARLRGERPQTSGEGDGVVANGNHDRHGGILGHGSSRGTVLPR